MTYANKIPTLGRLKREHEYRARAATITMNITERYMRVQRRHLRSSPEVFRKLTEWEAEAYSFFMRGQWKSAGY